MGKISQGILGGVSGKVGNVVGASWKGINYIRIMPASVANPRTEGQVNQRTKFSAALQFLQAIQSFIRVGYKFQQDKKSAFNAAMSYILKNAITGIAPDFSVDYALALVSRGKLTGASGSAVTQEPGLLTVSWDDNSAEGNAAGSDSALLLVYNPEKGESIALLDGVATRADGSADISIPGHFAGDTVEVYLAFQNFDGTVLSDSTHVGSEVID